MASAGFVVSLEIRASAFTELADVVFPVAAAVEKSGAYVNWEGRTRPFAAALPQAGTLDEARILDTLGVEMDVDLYTQTPAAASADMARLGVWTGDRPVRSGGRAASRAPRPEQPGAGFVLASWRMNLDGGRGLDGEPHLAGTARPDVARLSAAAALPRSGCGTATWSPSAGRPAAITLPVAVTEHARRRRLGTRPDRRHRHPGTARRERRRPGPGGGRRRHRRGRRKGTLMSALAGATRWLADTGRAGSRRFGAAVALRRPLVADAHQGVDDLRHPAAADAVRDLVRAARWSAGCSTGPARTSNGPFGLLQSLADAVKLHFKEGIIPARADKFVFIARAGDVGDPGRS